MDWLSYFFGLATLPALVVLLLLARNVIARLSGNATARLGDLSRPSSSPSPLQFNRRLVGKLRTPTEAEESTARAS